MHTPPPDDETMDQAPRHFSQRGNSVAGPRYRPARSYYYSRPYHSDEHPEVPKVKRASLDLDRAPHAPGGKVRRSAKDASRQTSTEKNERVGRTLHRSSPSSARGGQPLRPGAPLRTKDNRVSFPRVASHERRARAKVQEEDIFEAFEEDTEHTEATPRTATKIMVAHRRRSSISTVYEPPTSSYRSQGRRTKQRDTLFTFIQQIGRNRTFMLLASIVIVLLLLLPIIVNTVASNARSVTTISVSGTAIALSTPEGVQSTRIASPSDPHGLLITPTDTDHPAPPVFATSAYLLDADTGMTLYAHNPFMHLPMLSTTKLMTAVLAVEKGNPDQKITITGAISNDINQLAADSSVMGIKKGETYTLRELLYGMFLMSGNDAATAVADSIGGNLQNFVGMMNRRANQLGLHDTHYMNPHGLMADGHYSSAHDLALLGRVALNIPLLRQVSGTKQYTLPKTAQHAEHIMFNGNQFLWWYPGADGGKPGWDGNKDFIQVVSVTRNHHHLIGVTMNTNDWWTDMRDLMNWGFDKFQWVSPHDTDLTNPIPYDSDWNYFVKDTKDVAIPTADAGRYYVYTGYSVSGIIFKYFAKNGGLQKFGFPTGLPKATATTSVSQQFTRSTIQCDTATGQCK